MSYYEYFRNLICHICISDLDVKLLSSYLISTVITIILNNILHELDNTGAIHFSVS